MTAGPMIWHFGMMAERWARGIHETPEFTYFEGQIEGFGQPVLDLACGTGRLLIPFLRSGVYFDGCDISADMLHYCREKSRSEGFEPRLVQMSMHEFSIDRKYRTIYICDSFGLTGSREKDLSTLRRCYEHLMPGGALLLNIQAGYTSPESWNMWVTENLDSLPQAWPEEGSRRELGQDQESIAYFRLVDLDPLEQIYTRQVRLEKWVQGERVATEEYTLKGNMYLKNEVLGMLQYAGFDQIYVHGNYTLEPADPSHREIIFTAVR